MLINVSSMQVIKNDGLYPAYNPVAGRRRRINMLKNRLDLGRPVNTAVTRRRIRPGPRYRDGGINIPKHFRDRQLSEATLKRRVISIQPIMIIKFDESFSKLGISFIVRFIIFHSI